MSVEQEADVYDKLVGQTLASRYLIETRLGEGAMGAVYRAKHVKVGRAFAVKVLHPRLLEDKKVLARFDREAELAGRLRHPNVIGVVDVGETPDAMRYMVMDFAEGPDLASLLSEAPMPAHRVMLLTRQLLEGLFHAHEQGLIHRDFKPENVIVEKDSHGAEVPRIVDFGIAILREGGESSHGPGRLTTNGLVLGTPHYMAPEQAVADPIDHRIDLFALGIIVYEMLSGKLPFDGTGAEVARANLLLDPPLISERVPYLEVDPLLEAFARRLMAKKRDQRPATAKIARDLLDLIDKDRPAAATALGVPLDAARPPMTTQPNQPVRKHTGEGTFPPPVREAGDAKPPQAAPTVTENKAVRSREAAISTQQTKPVNKKRRGPLIGAVIVGIGIIGGAAAVMFSDKDKPAANEKVAEATPTPTEPTPPTPPTVADPVMQPPVDTGSAGSAATPPVETGSDASTTDDGAAKTGTQTAKTGQTSKTGSKKTGAGKTGAKTGAVTTTQPTPPIETPTAKTINSTMVATQYKTVGAQLKALDDIKGKDATTDLWATYRRIRLSDAMSTQAKRDEATAILSKLTSDIARRKK